MINLLLTATTGDATTTPTAGSPWITLIMLGALLLFFYFIIYRPQKKQEKQVNEMRNSLAVGDEITTTGGIIGRVVSIKDETLVLETSAERTKIRILRSSVRSIDVKADDAQ
ncbi:MAG: preprotein translocase subunit YajC [Clostridia bacterium]|nr:preprotein translocase subunit YajC [Clostridia bacterium]